MTYLDALHASQALQWLAAFDPHVAGTLPLGVAVAGSDIDILCHAPDPDLFGQVAWRHFAQERAFSLHQWTHGERAVIARFDSHGWPFEIFGSRRPVREQVGWRHFEVEERLLALGGETFRAAIRVLRGDGLKTEPAFARALGLDGDPYAALLALHARDDAELLKRIDHSRRDTAASKAETARTP
ncbi:DUF4269 domain-containing protein [Ancylobacter amanitiformis]|uniref:DUF4269 domain-containing protein n=1 Tax=Ancylobacter amanitiformis TaxID=217069 RepID=A0ABU0LUZ4_9HYPH|nr:DUF4269 domain-containing protein [Ancylobacter amanitiformis]MDQ0512489.1 hypothetical protein [Ancylobacter amanitiformis]